MPLLRNKIIEVADVSLRYDRLPVLTDIDLTVFKDDFLVITGPNGGGKTSLLRIILGLQLPSRGAVHFYREGQLAHNLNIGYLPQKNVIDSRFPITVSEVVFSGLSGSKKIFSRFTKKEQEQVGNFIEYYLQHREQITLVIFLVDIRHTPTANDKLMYDYIIRAGLPCLILANKADKIAITKVDTEVKKIQQFLNPMLDITTLPFSSERKNYSEAVWDFLENFNS